MSNTFRYRRGNIEPVFKAIATAIVIEIGDLIFQHPTADAWKPASAMNDQGSLDLNQDMFADFFLGVALAASRNGDTAPIGVAPDGEFGFACDSATFSDGDLVGPVETSGGDALEDQKVVAVTDLANSIGVVAKSYSSSTTKVLIRIRSTIMRDSVQAPVTGGSSSGPL